MGLKLKKIMAPKVLVEGFKCNRCGTEHDSDDFVEMQEMVYWQHTGGFGSIWGDGATVEVALCQQCAFEVFGQYVTESAEHEPAETQ